MSRKKDFMQQRVKYIWAWHSLRIIIIYMIDCTGNIGCSVHINMAGNGAFPVK